MPVEMWDILDAGGNPTGKKIRRDMFNRMPVGGYHLVVHIWVIDSSGRFLIQRRSLSRMPMPGEWAATSGSVISDESSCDAAVRELGEELGVFVRENEIHYLGRISRKNSLTDIWFTKVDAALSSLILQKEEVIEAAWVTPDELRQMIDTHRFHNYGKEYFDLVFSLANAKK